MYCGDLRVIGSNGFGLEEVAGVTKHALKHYLTSRARALTSRS
jgi:hypothetical protein